MALTRQQAMIEMNRQFEEKLLCAKEQNQQTWAFQSEVEKKFVNHETAMNLFLENQNLLNRSTSTNPATPTTLKCTLPQIRPPDPLYFHRFSQSYINQNNVETCRAHAISNRMSTQSPKSEFPKFDGTMLREWIRHCEHFFWLDKTPPELQARVASLHMEGKALEWHRNFITNHYGIFPSWTDYAIALFARFGEVSPAVTSTPYIRGSNIYGCSNKPPGELKHSLCGNILGLQEQQYLGEQIDKSKHRSNLNKVRADLKHETLIHPRETERDTFLVKKADEPTISYGDDDDVSHMDYIKSGIKKNMLENETCDVDFVGNDDGKAAAYGRDINIHVSSIESHDVNIHVSSIDGTVKIDGVDKTDDSDVIEVEKEEKHAQSKEGKSENLFAAHKDQNQDDEPLVVKVQNLTFANESENNVDDYDADILVLHIDGDNEIIGTDKNEEDNIIGVEVHGNLTSVLKDDLESKKEEEEKHEGPKEEISDEDKVCSKGVVTLKEDQNTENNFYVVKGAIKDESVYDVDFSDFVELQHRFKNWDIEAYKLIAELTKDASHKRIHQWVAKAALQIAPEHFNGIAMAYDQMSTKKIFTFGRLEEDTTACSFMLHVQRSLVENNDSIPLVKKGKLVPVDLAVSKHVYKSGRHLQAHHLVLKILKTISSGILFASFVRIGSLDVERTFNEPAAALSFGMTKKESLFIVFDPGGGTFDIPGVDIDVKRKSHWRLTKIGSLGSAKTSPKELTPVEVNESGRLDIDPTSIVWRKVMEVNDWLLKEITIGHSFEGKEMTSKVFVPNEIMVVLALTTSLGDLKKRFGKMVMDKCKTENPMTIDQGIIVVQGAYDCGLIYVTDDDGQVFIYSAVDNVKESDVLNRIFFGCNEEIGDEKLLGDEEHFFAEARKFEELWELTWRESELMLEIKMLKGLDKVLSMILVQWKDKPPDQVT